MDEFRVQIGSDAELIAAADGLRRRVFIEEQGVPKREVFDGRNGWSQHVVIWAGDTPVATARLMPLCTGKSQIGLVAVDKAWRGQHLGQRAVRACMDCACENGVLSVFLAAQRPAMGFYEKLGFVSCGREIHYPSGFVLVPMRYTFAEHDEAPRE